MPVLITGVAGFIGYHVARRLCEAGIEVVGIDNLNAYYSVELKRARLQALFGFPASTSMPSTSPTLPICNCCSPGRRSAR